MKHLRYLLCLIVCCVFGAFQGWLTLNTEWYPVMTSVIFSVVSGFAFSVWVVVKFCDD